MTKPLTPRADLSKYPVLATSYPHIAERIDLMWSYQELNVYLASLTLQNRDLPRAGFPVEALVEISKVQEDHLMICPLPQGKKDLWAIA
jgi:hypothetical protein